MIATTLLQQYGAVQLHVPKAVLIFNEGEEAVHYYQIISGEVKMVNFGDGKEFVQGIFQDGQSFGEPPFFARKPYPASALTTRPTSLWRCSQPQLRQLLQENVEVHWHVTQLLSERLIGKARVLEQVAISHAGDRLLRYIDQLKQQAKPGELYKVPYTRQQLADLLGLRVETVIRTVKQLERRGDVTIRNGKLWR
ncbi:Crp/Fnr family transcriptional regulator [Spirosoma luteolum]